MSQSTISTFQLFEMFPDEEKIYYGSHPAYAEARELCGEPGVVVEKE